MNDVAKLRSAGFALGASFENSMVFDDERLLNAGGLRYADECARHKVLDAIGDLALAGLPLIGSYRSVRGGHKVNHAVLTALMADRTAWRVVEGQPVRVRAVRPKRSAEWWAGWLRPTVPTCPDSPGLARFIHFPYARPIVHGYAVSGVLGRGRGGIGARAFP